MDIVNLEQCQKHKKNNYTYIQINKIKKDKSIYFCDDCIYQNEDFKLQNFIKIDQILKYQQCPVINSWPPLENEKTQRQLSKILNKSQDKNEAICEQIEKFFDSFIKKINQNIIECKKQIIISIQKNQISQTKILQTYNEISQVHKISDIINQNSCIQQKQEQLIEIIEQFQKQKEFNEQIFSEMIQNYKALNQNFNFSNIDYALNQINWIINQIPTYYNSSLSEFKINFLEQIQANEQKADDDGEQQYQKLKRIIQKDQELQNEYINLEKQKQNAASEAQQLVQQNNKIIKNSIKQLQDMLDQYNLNQIPEDCIVDQDFQLIKKSDLLSKFNLTLSQYNLQEYKPILQRNKNSSQIIINNDSGDGQRDFYSTQILKPNSLYLIKIKLKTRLNEYGLFEVGLIRDSQKEKKYCYEEQLCFSYVYEEQQNQFQLTQNMESIEKNLLGDFIIKQQEVELQIKIQINQGILQVETLPSKSNIFKIAGINQKNIQKNKDFRLFFGFCGLIELNIQSFQKLKQL
ncbi:hypothetical protein ABPG72_017477 [Tetrahymena utriculariae]